MKEIVANVSKMLGTRRVYLVGGSLRDVLLGKVPKDYDFCTSLTPDEIEAKVRAAGRKPYLIGKRFGTVGCKFEINGKYELIEITTFRNETYKDGSRKPDVSFTTSLQEDLSRRDFTINAMAMDRNGKIYDYFGGQNDLANKLIRGVKSSKQRFKEDPLRILRAARFSATLKFRIWPETLHYMTRMKFEILKVSKERWVIELDKMIGCDAAYRGFLALSKTGVLGIMFPELSLQIYYDQDNPHHRHELWIHTLLVLTEVPKEEINLRWAALLHDMAKPFTRTLNKKGYSNYISHELLGADMSLKVSEYLKFSNERRDYIYDVIKNHMNEDSPLKKYDNAAK